VIPGREYMRAYEEFITGRFNALGSLGKSTVLNLN
jgi:hypothetical protein